MTVKHAARACVMRRMFSCALLGFAAIALSGAGQPAPPRRAVFNAQQQADLDRINAYLNGLTTLKSNFVQLGPDGQLDQGEFYLEKPGRMRFAYNAPNPTLVVATGGKVYVKNARLNTVDPYDLSDTPLGLLLNANIDLKHNSAVLDVKEEADALVVTARSSSNRNQGNITLVFSFPTIELRQWTVKDNQGGSTTVALSGSQPGAPLTDDLFAVPVKAPAIKKGG